MNAAYTGANEAMPGGRSSGLLAMGAQERRKWSSFVRQADAFHITTQLFAKNNYGVVITAQRGAGKTMLARSVEAQLGKSTYSLRLYGSKLRNPVPYGLFDIQMALLPESMRGSSATTVGALVSLINREAGGRPILLILDDVGGVDTDSLAVIMHLLLTEKAQILVLVRELSEIPHDFVSLLKDGFLTQHRLSNFSRLEVRELLHSALEGSVSESAVTSLHKASRGNPLVLQALFNHQVENGNLIMFRKAWAIAGPITWGQSSLLADLVRAQLSEEHTTVRSGVERMALIRQAPLPMVIAALGSEAYGEMEKCGYLHVDTSAQHLTSLREPHIGEVVRNWLSLERKAQLYDELSASMFVNAYQQDSHHVMEQAIWANEAGVPIQNELALVAADAALQQFNPLLALQCTVQIDMHSPHWVCAAVLRSRACNMMSDYLRAVSELEMISPHNLNLLGAKDYALWTLSLTTALVCISGGVERVPQLLEKSKQQISLSDVAGVEQREAHKLLRLAHLYFQVNQGNVADVADELELLWQGSDDPVYRLTYAALLVPTWVLMGRELDAITLAQEIITEISAQHITLLIPDVHTESMLAAMIWTGQWRQGIETIHAILDTFPQALHYAGGKLELTLGLALVYAGRGGEATDVLLAAAAQLQVRGDDSNVALVLSALAFAYAQSNNRERAIGCLTEAARKTGPMSWISLAHTTFCGLMARRWLGEPGASAELVALAKIDMAARRYTTASLFLFGATVLGHQDELVTLEKSSLRRQGAMALVNARLARAMRTGSAAEALQAAMMAEELELDAVAARCIVVALDLAKDSGNVVLARAAQQRLDILGPRLPKLPLIPKTAAVTFTKRELQIATLAAQRMSNRAIAVEIGLSVRTVEGHLYQIFTKLGIASRQEINQIQGGVFQ